MISFFNRWLPLALVALAAFWLRVHDLARRPMHADEANQAVKAGELLETGHYAFDANDHHGPTLYFAVLPIAWLRGQHTLAALDETTVRLVPAITGTIGVLLLAVFVGGASRPDVPGVGGHVPVPAFKDPNARSDAGTGTCPPTIPWPALAAAALMAVSPPAVYYSRYFVQETLLVTFTLAALVCAQHWWRTGRAGWVVGTGVSAGLMMATKESAPLFVVAALAAVFVAPAAGSGRIPAEAGATNANLRSRLGRDVAFAVGAALVVAVIFYSSFGTHPAGVRDALAAIGHGLSRAMGDSGHEKPWWYYARLFAWQRSGGVVFEQVALSALALAGAVVAGKSLFAGDGLKWHGRLARVSPDHGRDARATKSPASRLLTQATLYLAVIAVVLSLMPYKTPWHAVQFVPGLALLAAGALAAVPNRWVAAGLGAVALATQCYQTKLVAFTYAADARNPYAYVHSSPDVLKFRALAEAALARAPKQPVRVIGEEYWPLPWYFRGLPDVGYWSSPPDQCDGALVIVLATQAAAVRARLHGAYRESFLGLRPGVLCVVFTPISP